MYLHNKYYALKIILLSNQSYSFSYEVLLGGVKNTPRWGRSPKRPQICVPTKMVTIDKPPRFIEEKLS